MSSPLAKNTKNERISRRDLLRTAALLAGSLAARDVMPSAPPTIPIIDTHIHLFDPTRPGGIPWPEPSDAVLYKPALPRRYESISHPFGVVGAIAIEASPLAKDNDWLLGIAQQDPFIVGIIGDLIPNAPDFATELERLHKNPLFLGLRYGNLWHRDLVDDLYRPGFMEGLKLLAQAGLVFESANPNVPLIRTLGTIAERIPDLTIVIDHLPHATPSRDAAYTEPLRTLGNAPKVFVKLSEIPPNIDGRVPTALASYQETLDQLWTLFGEDKTLFGSDWPNSDHLLPFPETVGILKSYASGKSRIAQEKLFWRNSIHAYRWRPRLLSQPR